jgi:cell division protein FtsL
MFKYIAAILKTISPAQRVIALSIVLLSITLISVGPKIVSSFTQDTEELKAKVELQRTEIAGLTTRVNELNKQVLDNQRACTNEIIQKEKL